VAAPAGGAAKKGGLFCGVEGEFPSKGGAGGRGGGGGTVAPWLKKKKVNGQVRVARLTVNLVI